MRQIRITINDGTCMLSLTKSVVDLASCIESAFTEENQLNKRTTRNTQNIKLEFKDGEVLGRLGWEVV
jgi:hypothetical protein